jgi:hypothetical protein
MTVRITNLTVADDSTDSYVGHRPLLNHEIDVLAVRRHQAEGFVTPMADRLVLSAARYEMREGHPRSHRHSFGGVDRFPSIKGLVVTTGFDEWGRNIFADIEYDSHGHRATYGGRFDHATGNVEWTCYMD